MFPIDSRIAARRVTGTRITGRRELNWVDDRAGIGPVIGTLESLPSERDELDEQNNQDNDPGPMPVPISKKWADTRRNEPADRS